MSIDMSTLESVARALANGEITSVELTEFCLARAQDVEGEGSRVFTRLMTEQALASARASDTLRKAGLMRSEIDGVVLAVKDLFDIRGFTTRAGSVVLENAPVASRDAVIVDRLRQAGAVILGTTNMTEFAFSGLGMNPHYGTPRNPWDRQTGRIPGGSSSGSAVAVSDSMACAAIGTDTGGSVRIPAALCGLTGFKPTASRIDQSGTLPLSPSLDSIGPIANSVKCCMTLDAVMAGASGEAPQAAEMSSLVFGLPRQMFLDGVDAHVQKTFESACDRLRDAGASIIDLDLPELGELAGINHAGGFAAAESWAWHRKLLEQNEERYDPRVAVRIRRGAMQSASDFIDLQKARASWIARISARLSRIDAMIMPTVPTVAPAISALEHDEALYTSTNLLMLRNPSVINFMDGCALSLPCHKPDQAPVGLMLACTRHQDRRLLSIGLACESVLGYIRQAG